MRDSHPHCGYLCQHSYFAALQCGSPLHLHREANTLLPLVNLIEEAIENVIRLPEKLVTLEGFEPSTSCHRIKMVVRYQTAPQGDPKIWSECLDSNQEPCWSDQCARRKSAPGGQHALPLSYTHSQIAKRAKILSPREWTRTINTPAVHGPLYH